MTVATQFYELEEKRSLLSEKILIEQCKERQLLTKDEVVKHISNALRKNPKQLIDLLVKKIRLYNDKIEIDLHFTDKKVPMIIIIGTFAFISVKRVISLILTFSNQNRRSTV